jgi:hypothetical protein
MSRLPKLTPEQHLEIAARIGSRALLRSKGVGSPKGSDLLLRAVSQELAVLLPDGADPLTDAQRVYTEVYAAFRQAQGIHERDAHTSANQSWKSASGSFFQEYVKAYINRETTNHGLIAVTAKELKALELAAAPGEPSLIGFLEVSVQGA